MHRVDTLPESSAQGVTGDLSRSGTFRQWYDDGYAELVPIIPPDAVVGEGVPHKSRGKAPGVLGKDGLWRGLKGWQKCVISEADIVEWDASGAGIGLRRGAALPIDFDIDDPNLCERVKQIAFDVLGTAPIRVGRAPRYALLYRVEGELGLALRKMTIDSGPNQHVIEFPKQMVVEGVHPLTNRSYEWDERRRLESLTPVTRARLDRFMEEVERSVPGARWSKQPPATAQPSRALAAAPGREELIEEIVQKLPNDRANFPNRSDMISMMMAIKGALPDRPGAAEDLARDWAERWEGDGFSHDAFDRDWKSLASRSLGAEYILQKAERIIPAADAAPWTARYWFDPVAEMDVGDPTPQVKRRAPTVFRARAPSAIPPRQWLYGNHYIRKFLSATVAPGGLGKSSLGVSEALAMVTGRPLLGVRPHGKLRVWIWNGEDPLEEIERRVVAAMQLHGVCAEDIGDRLLLSSGRDMEIVLARTTREGGRLEPDTIAWLTSTLLEQQVDVLIADPFVSMHRVPENDNGAIDAISKALGRIAQRANAAIELVHHTRKTGGAEATVEDSRGASALVNATRSTRALVRMSQSEAEKLGAGTGYRRYFRIGADPKNNLAPPAADDTTEWFELRSVPLSNGTLEYPRGDNVGAVIRYQPATSKESLQQLAANTERGAIAAAVLTAMGGRRDVAWSDIRAATTGELNRMDITRSTARAYVTDKVTAALAGGVVVLNSNGQTVRLEARHDGAGDRAPWRITVEIEDASDASPDPFA